MGWQACGTSTLKKAAHAPPPTRINDETKAFNLFTVSQF
jgi:hypothetical protein